VTYDLLVLNETHITPEYSRKQDIAVEGDKIVAVAGRGELVAQAAKVIDAAGCLVIPGGVDPHVHYAMRFGPIDTEGPEFSAACAYGGTTTVIRNGVPIVKAMMCYDYSCDDGQLRGLMNEVGRRGGMSLAHAEDEAIANWLTGQHIRDGKVYGAYISEVRGAIVWTGACRPGRSPPSSECRCCTPRACTPGG
jgi:N-acyl-D-aspartate/D-glutamate deacylase